MRIAARVTLVLALAATPLLTAISNAQATDSPASLTMHSDPGDFLGLGQDYSYARPQDQIWANLGYHQNTVYAKVNGLNGDNWTVELVAPDYQPLHTGTYLDAQEAPFQQPGYPGINVNRGFLCQAITGQFDVLDIEYTANGTLTYLDATFEEHCVGSTAGLTGELIYTPPPPLPPLSFNVDIDDQGTIGAPDSLWMTASGTVTCNQYVWTTINVTLNQTADNSNPAWGVASVSCSPGSKAHWTATAWADTPLRPGRANAMATAGGQDGYTGTIANAEATADIELIPHSD